MQTKSRLPSDQSDSETFIFIKFNTLTLNTRTWLRLVDARALSLSLSLSLSFSLISLQGKCFNRTCFAFTFALRFKRIQNEACENNSEENDMVARHEFLIILAKHEKVATQHRHGNRNQIHAILQKNSDCDKNSFNHISNTNYIRLHITIATHSNYIYNIL